MYYKGMVLKIRNSYALVLTSDNEYMRIQKKNGMRIGQKIIFTEQDLISTIANGKESSGMKKKILSAALIACLALAVILRMNSIDVVQTYALVSLDINPSIGIIIDEENKVLETINFNDDAENITNENMLGKDILLVLDEMIRKAEELDYLNDANNNILISSATLEEDALDNLEDIITDYLENETEFSTDVSIIYIESDEETAADALDEGVSLGKLEIYNMMAEELDYDLTVAEIVEDPEVRMQLENNFIIRDREELTEEIHKVLIELEKFTESDMDIEEFIIDIEDALLEDETDLLSLLEDAEDLLEDVIDDLEDLDEDVMDDLEDLDEDDMDDLEDLDEDDMDDLEDLDEDDMDDLEDLDEDDMDDLEDLDEDDMDNLEDLDEDDTPEMIEDLNEVLLKLEEFAASNEEVARFIDDVQKALSEDEPNLESLLMKAEALLAVVEMNEIDDEDVAEEDDSDLEEDVEEEPDLEEDVEEEPDLEEDVEEDPED